MPNKASKRIESKLLFADRFSRRYMLNVIKYILPILMFVGCTQQHQFIFNEENIQLWSNELAQQAPYQGPYFSHFQTNGFNLYYVAAHSFYNKTN